MDKLKYDFKNMKDKATLNKRGWKTLPNGNSIPADEVLSTFWFGYVQNSLEYMVKTQLFDTLKDTLQIYTRHNEAFRTGLKNENYSVTIKGVTYTIALLQSDDTSLNGVDILTLSQVS